MTDARQTAPQNPTAATSYASTARRASRWITTCCRSRGDGDRTQNARQDLGQAGHVGTLTKEIDDGNPPAAKLREVAGFGFWAAVVVLRSLRWRGADYHDRELVRLTCCGGGGTEGA